MATSKVKSYIHTTTPYPDTLSLAETEVPSQPAPNHILVKIKAASINPVDIQLMNLTLFNLPYLSGPKLIARDFSGTILASSSPDFLPNDAVCGIIPADFFTSSGSLTEVAHIDISKSCIIKKPSYLSHSQAASLPLVYLTARTSIEKVTSAVSSGSKRLVILGGSSSTGIYGIKLAVARGWQVLSSCSGSNAEFVRSLGAQVVDYTTHASAVVEAVKAFKPDAIIDNVGGIETIGLAGHYVTIVGDKTSRASMGGSAIYLTHPKMVARYFLGAWGYGPKYECIVLDTKREWLEEIDALKGEDVVLDSTFPWDRTKDAFERMNTGRCRGKVVIELED